MSFDCPICACQCYDRVVVQKSSKRAYETEFFVCLGCSVMFLEPELFTAAPEFRRTARADNPQMAHEVAALQRAREYRFWEARATRHHGGTKPPAEFVMQIRQRYGR